LAGAVGEGDDSGIDEGGGAAGGVCSDGGDSGQDEGDGEVFDGVHGDLDWSSFCGGVDGLHLEKATSFFDRQRASSRPGNRP
jgi:hypothetical protein